MASAAARVCDRITVAVVPEKFPDPKQTFEILFNVELPPLKADQVLVQTQYISVDPYLRGRLNQCTNGKPVYSHCVGKIIEIGSNVKGLNISDFVYGIMPWQTYSNINEKRCHKIPSKLPKYIETINNENDEKKNNNNNEMIDISKINKSYYIGLYGMPGQTAYYGLYEKGNLKQTDNVLISGAAGAVGSMAGQLARLKGCKKIVGTAGTKEKCDFMLSIGFTDVINYKEYKDTNSMQKRLKV